MQWLTSELEHFYTTHSNLGELYRSEVRSALRIELDKLTQRGFYFYSPALPISPIRFFQVWNPIGLSRLGGAVSCEETIILKITLTQGSSPLSNIHYHECVKDDPSLPRHTLGWSTTIPFVSAGSDPLTLRAKLEGRADVLLATFPRVKEVPEASRILFMRALEQYLWEQGRLEESVCLGIVHTTARECIPKYLDEIERRLLQLKRGREASYVRCLLPVTKTWNQVELMQVLQRQEFARRHLEECGDRMNDFDRALRDLDRIPKENDLEYSEYRLLHFFQMYGDRVDAYTKLIWPFGVSYLDRLLPFFRAQLAKRFPESSLLDEFTTLDGFSRGEQKSLLERYAKRDWRCENESIAKAILQIASEQGELSVPLVTAIQNAFESRSEHPGLNTSIQGFISHRSAKTTGFVIPKRIAVCISGQLRGYDRSFPTIKKHLVDPLQADVFLSSWDRVGVASGAHGSRVKRSLPQTFGNFLPDTITNIAFAEDFPVTAALIGRDQSAEEAVIRESFPNAEILLEDPKPFHDEMLRDLKPDLHSGLQMVYRMHTCYEMLQQHEAQRGIRYDFIIWIRPDCTFEDFALPPMPLSDSQIYSHQFASPWLSGDYLLCGAREVMGQFFQIWKDCMLEKPSGPGAARPYLGHGRFFHYLFERGIVNIDLTRAGGKAQFWFSNPVPSDTEFTAALEQDLSALKPEALPTYEPAIKHYYSHLELACPI